MLIRRLLFFLGLFFLSTFVSAKAQPAPQKNILSLFQSSDMGRVQDQGKIFSQVLKNSATEPISVRVSLSQQRVFVFVGNQLAISSPVSSGRRPGWTPEGTFKVLEKDPAHRSSIYGNFVDNEGRVIRGGVDNRADSAPSGTHFQGAPMLYFMRLTDKGVGMHVGMLPGYPASHGCIRLPEEMAKAIYEIVPLNTIVTVES